MLGKLRRRIKACATEEDKISSEKEPVHTLRINFRNKKERRITEKTSSNNHRETESLSSFRSFCFSFYLDPI